MKRLKRPIRNYLISKFVGLFLVGTLHAAVPSPKVVQFAHAIAQAEGYNLKGSIPNRCNNPGDLKGTAFPGQIGVCKGGHARFKNAAAGWAALYHQIEKIEDGASTKYTRDTTFGQIARTYAQNYRPWVKIVTKMLNVDEDTQILDYFTKQRTLYLANDFDFNQDLEWGGEQWRTKM